MLTVALFAVACGEEATTTSTTGSTASADPTATITDVGPVDTASVIDAGMLTPEDIPEGGQFGPTEQVEVDSNDLPVCEDLSVAVEGVAAGLDDGAVSPQFRTETEGTAVSITAFVRDSVLVYGSEPEAADAFSSTDEEAFRKCAVESVNAYWEQGGPEEDEGEIPSPDEIHISEGPDFDAGDESAAFELQMDSSVYGDQDNEERATLVPVRVGPAVAVFTFLYSGQYFEDFETQTDAEQQVVQRVVERVDAALA